MTMPNFALIFYVEKLEFLYQKNTHNFGESEPQLQTLLIGPFGQQEKQTWILKQQEVKAWTNCREAEH